MDCGPIPHAPNIGQIETFTQLGAMFLHSFAIRASCASRPGTNTHQPLSTCVTRFRAA
jgi:hypothetical protein